MTLTFGTHTASGTHLDYCIWQLLHHSYNNFCKIHCLNLFPYKSIREQIWPCRKIGQGQPRVIIWIILVALEYPMLHTNFQGHRPFGSREEEFFHGFIIYRHGGHLGNVTWAFWIHFCSSIPLRLHMKSKKISNDQEPIQSDLTSCPQNQKGNN